MGSGQEWFADQEEAIEFDQNVEKGKKIKQTINEMKDIAVYAKWNELLNRITIIEDIPLTRNQYNKLRYVYDEITKLLSGK